MASTAVEDLSSSVRLDNLRRLCAKERSLYARHQVASLNSHLDPEKEARCKSFQLFSRMMGVTGAGRMRRGRGRKQTVPTPINDIDEGIADIGDDITPDERMREQLASCQRQLFNRQAQRYRRMSGKKLRRSFSLEDETKQDADNTGIDGSAVNSHGSDDDIIRISVISILSTTRKTETSNMKPDHRPHASPSMEFSSSERRKLTFTDEKSEHKVVNDWLSDVEYDDAVSSILKRKRIESELEKSKHVTWSDL